MRIRLVNYEWWSQGSNVYKVLREKEFHTDKGLSTFEGKIVNLKKSEGKN